MYCDHRSKLLLLLSALLLLNACAKSNDYVLNWAVCSPDSSSDERVVNSLYDISEQFGIVPDVRRKQDRIDQISLSSNRISVTFVSRSSEGNVILSATNRASTRSAYIVSLFSSRLSVRQKLEYVDSINRHFGNFMPPNVRRAGAELVDLTSCETFSDYRNYGDRSEQP
jgi:hypothetical protein